MEVAVAKKAQSPTPLSAQLREIIESSPMSRYRLAKMSGVDAGQIHRFLQGTGRLSTDTLDKIGAALKLSLVIHESEEAGDSNG